MNENYSQKAIKNVALVGGMLLISSFLAYGLRVVNARYLTAEDYGLFYAVVTLMMFLLIFRDFGLGSALTKFVSQYNVSSNYSKIKTLIASALLFQIGASLLLAASFIFFSSSLATGYFSTPKAIPLLHLLALYVVISMVCRLIHHILVGFQDTRWYSLTEPVRIGATLLVVIPLFKAGFGVLSPAIALVFGVSVSLVTISFGLVKYRFLLKHRVQHFIATTKELFSFALPVIFTGLGNKVIGHLDVLILTYFVPLASVGVYNVILPTALLFLFSGRAVSQVLFPLASELWAKGDHNNIARGVDFMYTYLLFFSMPAVVAAFVYADHLIEVLFGSQYLPGVLAFRILLPGVIGYLLAMNNHIILSAIGKPILVTKVVAISAVANVGLNMFLIPRYSINGAALATAVSYGVALVLSTKWLIRNVGVQLPWRKLRKISLLVFFFTICVLGLDGILPFYEHTRVVVSLFISLALYIPAAVSMRITSTKKLRAILATVWKP